MGGGGLGIGLKSQELGRLKGKCAIHARYVFILAKCTKCTNCTASGVASAFGLGFFNVQGKELQVSRTPGPLLA